MLSRGSAAAGALRSSGARGLRVACVVAACVGATACDEARTIEGEHVTFEVADEGAEICPGTVAYLDEAYRQIAETLGVPPEEVERVRYRYVPEGEEDYPCGELTFGCTTADGRDVWARRVDATHELVHAIYNQSHAEATIPYLEEGLAVALGQPIVSLGWDLSSYSTDVLATSGYDLDQTSAGHVVAHLLATDGYDAFAAVADALRPGATRAEIDAAFLDVYGADLATIVGAIDEYYIDGVRLGVPECDATPAPWIDGEVEVRTTFTCDDPRVVGDLSRGRGRVTTTVEIAESGTYLHRLRGTFRANFGPCAARPYYAAPSTSEGSGHRLAWIGREPGRLYMTIDGDPGSEAVVELQTLEPIPVEPCLTEVPAGAPTVDATVDSIAISASPTGALPEAHFVLDSAASATYLTSGVVAVELCSGTCGDQKCVALDDPIAPEIELDAGYHVLRGERAWPDAGASVLLQFVAP